MNWQGRASKLNLRLPTSCSGRAFSCGLTESNLLIANTCGSAASVWQLFTRALQPHRVIASQRTCSHLPSRDVLPWARFTRSPSPNSLHICSPRPAPRPMCMDESDDSCTARDEPPLRARKTLFHTKKKADGLRIAELHSYVFHAFTTM